MLYRDMNSTEAAVLMDWCEERNINLDWWNAIEVMADPECKLYQIGMEARHWDAWDQHKQEAQNELGQKGSS